MEWRVSYLLHVLYRYDWDSAFDVLSYLNYAVANRCCRLDEVCHCRRFPLLRDDPHLRLLVAGLYFHDAPIFFRCSSTRADSASTSSQSSGSGVA
jgi:hypothetical protein